MLIRATPEDYRDHLTKLLPQGEAWPREPDSVLGRVLRGLGGVFARVHNRGLDLIEEADPRTTSELLVDWERVCGLPDACSGLGETVAQRRAAVLARLTARGGQSRAYYVEVAQALGFDIAIREFAAHSCESTCTDPVCDEDWRFVWMVEAPTETVTELTVVSECTEPLRSWGNAALECAIARLKPAHTTLRFSYVSVLATDEDGAVLDDGDGFLMEVPA